MVTHFSLVTSWGYTVHCIFICVPVGSDHTPVTWAGCRGCCGPPGVSWPSRRLRMGRRWQCQPWWQVSTPPTGPAPQTAVMVSNVLTRSARAFCMSRSCLRTRPLRTKGVHVYIPWTLCSHKKGGDIQSFLRKLQSFRLFICKGIFLSMQLHILKCLKLL